MPHTMQPWKYVCRRRANPAHRWCDGVIGRSQWWRVALLGLAVLLLGGCAGGVQPTATALPSMTATAAGGASTATLPASSTPHPATAASAPPASPAATPAVAMCAPGVSFLGFSDALDKQQFQQTD